MAADTQAISSHITVDPHSQPQHHVTYTQLTLLIAYLIVSTVWMFRFLASFIGLDLDIFGTFHGMNRNVSENSDPDHSVKVDIENHKDDGVYKSPSNQDKQSQDSQTEVVKALEASGLTENLKDRHNHCAENATTTDTKRSRRQSSSASDQEKQNVSRPPAPPAVTFDKFLTAMVLFGAIMLYFYMCDYRKIFPQGDRTYSRDLFLFLVFLFFLVACGFTIKPNTDKILNREQTEEWKGWMQVMFVWYHYFKAKEWYNWIRVYIACYVWMTGFGNFSFFWVRSDFSMWRMLKMLFRLNFLVVFVAMVTNNEYMLYYICAMHTYWFFTVYIFMRVLNSWNKVRKLMAIKFAAYAVCNAIIFDIPGFSNVFFRPLWFILGLHDNSGDIMHEWSFRAGLDHWACFVGMLCAYNYPHFEALMQYLDSKSLNNQEQMKKLAIRIGMGFACVALGVIWYSLFMWKDKYSYNSTHPYTSMIPILIFIVGRNIHPVLRSYHIHMFAWLGKITLETYLSQLHIYLMYNARTLVTFIDGYPLLNLALATITYLTVSYILFTITNDCSNFLIPKDNKKLLIHGCSIVALIGVSALVAFTFNSQT